MHSLASHSDLTLAVAMVAVVLILLLGFVLGSLARRLRQPVVIGEISAGIILGPSALGLLPGQLTHRVFTADVQPMLPTIAQVGLLLFVFKIGPTLVRDLAATVVDNGVQHEFVADGWRRSNNDDRRVHPDP